jgi:hypothetical protein
MFPLILQSFCLWIETTHKTSLTAFKVSLVAFIVVTYEPLWWKLNWSLTFNSRTNAYQIQYSYCLFGHIHPHVSYLKQCFGDWAVPPSSGRKPTHLGPIDRDSPYSWTSEQIRGRMYKNTTLNNAEKVNNWIDMPSARIFRSYEHICISNPDSPTSVRHLYKVRLRKSLAESHTSVYGWVKHRFIFLSDKLQYLTRCHHTILN